MSSCAGQEFLVQISTGVTTEVTPEPATMSMLAGTTVMMYLYSNVSMVVDSPRCSWALPKYCAS